MEKIAARYIGSHHVLLAAGMGPYYDAQGQRKEDLTLSYGDTLMMPAEEVLGKTVLRLNDQLFVLGHGQVIRPEDKNKSEEELSAIGYTFHQGRSDFEAVTAATSSAPASSGSAPVPASPDPAPAPVQTPPAATQQPSEEGK